MEPMETEPNPPAGEPTTTTTAPPTISPAADGDAGGTAGVKRPAKDNASDEDEAARKPAKKQKKGVPPPVVKRKTAIESSDEDEGGEDAPPAATDAAGPAGAHQVMSTAVKVDPSLPHPGVPSPPPAAEPNGSSATTNGNGHSSGTKKPAAESSDMSEEEVPLSQKKRQRSKTASRSASPKAGPSRSAAEEEEKPPKLPPIKRNKKPASAKKEKEPVSVKREPPADMSDSESDAPLKSRRAAAPAKGKKRKSMKEDSDSGDNQDGGSSAYSDEKPEKRAAPKKKAAATKKKTKKATPASSDLSSEEDDKPLKVKAAAKKSKAPMAKKGAKKEETDGSDTEKPLKKVSAAEKKKAAAKASQKKEDDEADAEEEKYRWWEHQKEDASIKWETLQHNGVLFPPAYEPLPATVKLKYDGQEVDLPPESEEVAGFFGKMIETDHAQDKVFRANFFRDFKTVLKKFPPRNGIVIADLDNCDFSGMYAYYEEERERTKSLNAAAKKELKKAREEAEKDYQYCILDGRKEKVGNFRVEPPGLFRGRGEHPKKGTHKFRLRPEDITINIDKDAPVPIPNVPGKWKAVQHDQKVTWLATWNENVNGNIKYVFLAAGSSLKGQSDMAKFEKARKLKDYIEKIRADYTRDLKDKDMGKRQRATAMYFIDVLALRAGNEKGEDEADTVGCCSLRLEHLQLQPPNQLRFDFLGKDSIRYLNVVEVDPQVFKNVKIFKKDKEETDQIFDRLETTGLNKHLSSLMPGLSAKVFRTYNASWTMQERLDAVTDTHASIPDKLLAYNRANREVAVLCNHQKAVSKGHSASMQKLNDKVLALKYQRMKLRQQAHDLDEKTKKKAPFDDAESDLDDEWVTSHEEELEQLEIERKKKSFEKLNEKRADAKEDLESEDTLREQIKAIKAKWKDTKKQTAKRKAEAKASQTVDKIKEAIGKLDERIAAAKMTVVDRDEGSAVALGTSKINYIDPRITVAWAKKHDVPVEKLLSKVLIDKFQWAVEIDEDYRF